MPESIIYAILDESNTIIAVSDGDWTATLAVEAAENPPPVIDDEGEAA